MKASWEIKAEEKRASTHAKIPNEWLLDKATLDEAAKHRNLTGPFIEEYLTHAEISITNEPSLVLIKRIRDGELSALSVAKAYCHRTAIAEQIVRMFLVAHTERQSYFSLHRSE